MNIRDLDYICAVAEYRHFGRAAEACHVSQPTLSGQIKKLEIYLGVTLFERNNKSVRVTKVGEDIIRIAKEARNNVDRIRTIASAAQDPLAGHLSLGLIPTIAPYLIPIFVSRLSQDLPDLQVTYSEDITERLTEDLLSGALDTALMATPPDDEALTAIALFSEPFWLVFPHTHPLKALKQTKMSDVPQQDILLLTEGHCFRDQALSICTPQNRKHLGHKNKNALRATSLETLVNLVASGQGMTLVPALAMRGRGNDTGLISRKLTDKGAARTIYLTYRKRYPRKAAVSALSNVIQAGLPKTVQVL